jgi:hypothetical protein
MKTFGFVYSFKRVAHIIERVHHYSRQKLDQIVLLFSKTLCIFYVRVQWFMILYVVYKVFSYTILIDVAPLF